MQRKLTFREGTESIVEFEMKPRESFTSST